MHGKRWPPLLLALLVLLEPVGACGPGRGAGGRRAARRKLTPLVFKQHVPNVSENTLGASGLPEGRVSREDPRFKDLVPNHNPDILFKDEEDNGADRLMTKRCMEKLNTLAISVMNQWPGVKLRVIEAWDEEGVHATDSLHYEGRAVDITTSDRDRSKYGLLARLAVQAGFDWVYYESRSHIHCSVKSESSQAAKSGGCFHTNGSVDTPTGRKPLWSVRPGDQVLAAIDNDRLIYSDVIQLLDRDVDARRLFYIIETERGARLIVTPHHLVPVLSEENERRVIFALRVRTGQSLYVHRGGNVTVERVIGVTTIVSEGIVAPLTRHGTIVVDDVVVSCYALFEWPRLAHWAFWPVRVLSSIRTVFGRHFSSDFTGEKMSSSSGIHWYSELLYVVAEMVLPEHFLPK